MRLGKANRLALKVALFYVSVAVSWDFVATLLFRPATNKTSAIVYLEIFKACGLAVITGGLIYWLLTRPLRRWRQETEKREQSEAGLERSNSLLNAALESTADGILVVDEHGKVACFNQKFLQVWQIPAVLAASLDDQRLLQHVVTQLAEPDLFLAKVQELYHQPQAESWDELKFRDGRFFERYSKPQRIGDNVVGRVWSFRDISERKQGEAALRESEEHFRLLWTQSVDGIRVTDGAGIVVMANPAYCRMMGRPSEAVEGHSMSDVYLAENRAKIQADHQKNFISRGVKPRVETQVTLWNGENLWLDVSNSFMKQSSSQPLLLGLFRNITERKQAEERLRQSQERYVLTERAVADGMWEWDILTGEDIFSPRWKGILGYRDDELTNHKSTFLQLIHPNDRAAVDAVTRGHLEQGKPYALELRLRRKDGSYRWIFTRGEAVRDASGQPVRMFGATTDITERKQADAALGKSEEKLRRIFANAPVGIFQSTVDQLLFVNPAMATMFGYESPAEMVAGATSPAAFYVHPEQRRQMISEALASGTYTQGEVEEYRKDGSIFVTSTQLRVVRSDIGEIQYIEGFIQDITARKAAETALQLSEFSVNHASLATFWIAPDARIVRTNAAACAQLGYTEAELLQLAITDLDPDFPAERWPEHWQQLRDRKKMCFETRHRRKDGHIFPVEVDLNWFEFGGQEYNFAFTRDLTQRKQLESQQTQLAAIVQYSDDAIISKSLTGLITSWNRGAEKIFGYSAAEAVGQPLLMLFPAELQHEEADNIARIMRRETVENFASKRIRKDGRIIYISATISPLKDASGKIIGASKIARDITERKQALMALEESQLLYESLVMQLPIGIFQKDQAGRYVFVNPEFCRINGRPAESFLGKTVLELDANERANQNGSTSTAKYATAGDEHFRQIMQTGKPIQVDEDYDLADGTRRHLSAMKFPILKADGQIGGVQAVIVDVTERKRADEAHARLATVVEQALESIVVTDIKGKITYVNPAFERISGYTAAEVIGQTPRILKSGQHDAEFYQKLWAVLLHGEVWSGHFVNRRKDGKLYEEDATISPILDATGRVINYMAVKRDTTREVQLENQLRQSQKMEAIGQLAGGVAHDFNNILASTLMQVELLTGAPTAAEVQEGIEQIRADANRAANLTRQMLLFSRRQVMQPRVLDLNELITNLVKMLQRIIGEDVQLHLHLHSAELLTRADAGMLDQVLMNLVINARDAMPGGGQLRIETMAKTVTGDDALLHAEAIPGRYVCFSVTDSGGGISPEILPQIFEPFFTTKAAGKGTGLGLATVYGIVKQHQGWIQMVNRPGQGVTFQIFLPVINMPAEAAANDTQFRSRRGTETILLVEDEAGLLTVTQKILERQGYRVLSAANGHQALQHWQAQHASIALLLTDMVMPGGMSGQELARQLQHEKPGLKVAFTSGYSATIAGQEFRLGVDEAFLQKPYEADQLLKTVRASLDGKRVA
jgi:PAS domain S-box-containing protein